MEGLEKITAQIIADAKASCDKSFDDAKAEIEQIKKKYSDEAAKIIQTAEADAQKERESIVSRGASSAAMLRRNMLLQSKSKMVDKAYSEAVGYLSRIDKGEYLSMLKGMFGSAVKDTLASESALLSDEDGEYTAPDTFVVALNEHDSQKYLTELEKFVADTLKNTDKKYIISDKYADISGGMLITYGDMYINCSIEQAVEQIRQETESEVYRVLFGDK